MNHKIQLAITITVMISIMIGIGVLIGTVGNNLTGAAVQNCECQTDADCNDFNPMTKGVCLYAESCTSAKCIYLDIEN